MHPKSTPIFLLVVSLFQIAVLATANLDTRNSLRLATRQANTATVSCLEYATVANLSTIGLNSTFRAAFLQASPDGTDKSAGILNNAEKEIPALIDDKALNDKCGNLTAIALKDAPVNFTEGIVGPFKIKQASEATINGRNLGMVSLVVMVTMGFTVLL